jgi:pilus assembly protein Flp/PilA
VTGLPRKLYRRTLGGNCAKAIFRTFFVMTMGTRRTGQIVRSLLADESGQDLIEYALIAALIAVSAILAMKGLANKISNEFNSVGNSL